MNFKEMYGDACFVSADKSCLSPRFYSQIKLEEVPDKAMLTVCGLGFFELYINGNPVTDEKYIPLNSHYHHYDECYCYKKFGEELSFRIYSCSFDVSKLLKKGENELTATLAPGWYAPYGAPKLVYRLICGDKEFVSDKNVKWCDTGMTFYSITKGEEYNYIRGSSDAPVDEVEWQSSVVVDAPESDYLFSDCPTDKVIRTVIPKEVGRTKTHMIYDCGENITGTPVLKCECKGKRVNVLLAETLGRRGGFDKKRCYGQHLSFVSDGTGREYKLHFTWGCFRYISVPANAQLQRVEIIHSDVPLTAEFTCDNEVLNGFYNMYVRTQLDNMHSGIPSDCPHIERRGYTGDGQLTCESVMLMFGAKEFYKKWMGDIADSQDKITGHIQYTAPYLRSGGGPGGWGCAVIEVPYVYYKTYGDIEPLKQYFGNMLHYFDYLELHSLNELVIDDQPGEWHLGDWCTPTGIHAAKPEIPESFVNTYFYIKSLNRMIEIATVIGKTEYLRRFSEVKAKKIKALTDIFFNPETGDWCENKNSANAFALDLGLGDSRTLKNLADRFEKYYCFDTGIFGTDIAVKTLFLNGYYELAAILLASDKHPSFGYMLNNGATTIWEEWINPRSMCHPMFGAPVRFLFYYILGICQANSSAGYKSVVIKPLKVPFIKRASGSITTENGKISVSLDRDNDNLTVVVPNGIEAECGGVRLCSGENRLRLSVCEQSDNTCYTQNLQ